MEDKALAHDLHLHRVSYPAGSTDLGRCRRNNTPMHSCILLPALAIFYEISRNSSEIQGKLHSAPDRRTSPPGQRLLPTHASSQPSLPGLPLPPPDYPSALDDQ
ncbi:hypothetical protein FRX31_029666 [Thalictrum thalictroides]|uniref:Uncharacterized protein n=1 Tax=Thalictrum thalictroides TaxID=46969 RepID=A0A7J6V7J1_THATH|nr:hypothetical protein FRX31_029666 [Thalictrum thalictroides]